MPTTNLGFNDYTVGGDYDSWGTKFLEDMAVMDKVMGDALSITDTSGTKVLTLTECQNFAFLLTGSGSSTVTLHIPDGASRWWFVENNRAEGDVVIRHVSGGTSVTLTAGEKHLVRADGTNCLDLNLTSITIGGVTGLQAALDLKAPLASPTLTGTPAAPTASPGTNTTQLATTAFVTAAVAALNGAAILSALLSVDGTGSGLDADLLDGQEGAYYQSVSGLLSAILAIDGTGSGLDADLLDGNEATAFALAAHTHTFASLTSKPTTLSGYGITDGNPDAFGAVGTYVLALNLNAASYSAGDTNSGSNLRATNADAAAYSSALSGTWRCMGTTAGYSTNPSAVTLWKRIS